MSGDLFGSYLDSPLSSLIQAFSPMLFGLVQQIGRAEINARAVCGCFACQPPLRVQVVPRHHCQSFARSYEI